jgi:hypothetical protein
MCASIEMLVAVLVVPFVVVNGLGVAGLVLLARAHERRRRERYRRARLVYDSRWPARAVREA